MKSKRMSSPITREIDNQMTQFEIHIFALKDLADETNREILKFLRYLRDVENILTEGQRAAYTAALNKMCLFVKKDVSVSADEIQDLITQYYKMVAQHRLRQLEQAMNAAIQRLRLKVDWNPILNVLKDISRDARPQQYDLIGIIDHFYTELQQPQKKGRDYYESDDCFVQGEKDLFAVKLKHQINFNPFSLVAFLRSLKGNMEPEDFNEQLQEMIRQECLSECFCPNTVTAADTAFVDALIKNPAEVSEEKLQAVLQRQSQECLLKNALQTMIQWAERGIECGNGLVDDFQMAETIASALDHPHLRGIRAFCTKQRIANQENQRLKLRQAELGTSIRPDLSAIRKEAARELRAVEQSSQPAEKKKAAAAEIRFRSVCKELSVTTRDAKDDLADIFKNVADTEDFKFKVIAKLIFIHRENKLHLKEGDDRLDCLTEIFSQSLISLDFEQIEKIAKIMDFSQLEAMLNLGQNPGEKAFLIQECVQALCFVLKEKSEELKPPLQKSKEKVIEAIKAAVLYCYRERETEYSNIEKYLATKKRKYRGFFDCFKEQSPIVGDNITSEEANDLMVSREYIRKVGEKFKKCFQEDSSSEWMTLVLRLLERKKDQSGLRVALVQQLEERCGNNYQAVLQELATSMGVKSDTTEEKKSEDTPPLRKVIKAVEDAIQSRYKIYNGQLEEIRTFRPYGFFNCFSKDNAKAQEAATLELRKEDIGNIERDFDLLVHKPKEQIAFVMEWLGKDDKTQFKMVLKEELEKKFGEKFCKALEKLACEWGSAIPSSWNQGRRFQHTLSLSFSEQMHDLLEANSQSYNPLLRQ